MKKKNRKKLPTLVAPKAERDPLCQKFRKTANFLQRKNFANALTELNTLSGGNLAGNRKSQVVRLAAEIQIRQGDYLAAVSILKNEIQKIGPGATKWPSLVNAHLSSLLRANLVNEALDVSQIYQQQAEASYSPLPTVNLTAPGQTTTIAPRAIRPSVFATKVGDLFLQHGELMAATEFLKKATSLEPNGASCARSSLARICLSQAMYPQAEIYAAEALEKGMFRKKRCVRSLYSCNPALVKSLLR